jgi:ABC-2 type transport system permease protein
MRIIDLTLKDLTQLVRDWKAATFLVAMPVVFTLLFGFAFGGYDSGEGDPRLAVGFLDRDGGRLISASLLDMLEASGVIRPVVLEGRDADRADRMVRDEDLAAAVTIPVGYTDKLLAGDLMPLEVIVGEGASAGTTVRDEIQLAATRLAGSVQAAQLSAQAYGSAVGFADEAARQEFLEEAVDPALAAWADPPLKVQETRSMAIAEVEGGSAVIQRGFSHTSPSMMVQFAMAGLIGAAEILVLERKSRALQRLLTTAISRLEIILGHYLAMFVMILTQFALLVVFGQLVLQVNYLREPVATLLVMVTTALWTASLGLLVGTLAKTEDQVIIFCLIPMFILAGMGGVWMPLEFTGKAFQTIGHLLPTAWAMDGFENVVIRGLGLEAVLLPVGIMLAYALGLFALAMWRFRFE